MIWVVVVCSTAVTVAFALLDAYRGSPTETLPRYNMGGHRPKRPLTPAGRFVFAGVYFPAIWTVFGCLTGYLVGRFVIGVGCISIVAAAAQCAVWGTALWGSRARCLLITEGATNQDIRTHLLYPSLMFLGFGALLLAIGYANAVGPF